MAFQTPDAGDTKQGPRPRVTFIIEHLDPELGPWSALEYKAIAAECRDSGCGFILSSVPGELRERMEKELEKELRGTMREGGEGAQEETGYRVEGRSVEELFPVENNLGAGDEGRRRTGRICLLDPQAERELASEDRERFEGFLFGGILGDDPPRDRTSELRKKGYEGRRLGPVQMTTDTAVRVTRMVVQDQVPLDKIPFIDFPELTFDEHESTVMPFRYVKAGDGAPVMPKGMIELIKKDADKGFDDFL